MPTFLPDEPLSPREEQDVIEFLKRLRELRQAGGWGSLTFELKNGDLNEVRVNTVYKPKEIGAK